MNSTSLKKNFLLFSGSIIILPLFYLSCISLDRISFRRTDHTKIKFINKKIISNYEVSDTLKVKNVTFMKLTTQKLLEIKQSKNKRIVSLVASWCPYSEYNLYKINRIKDSLGVITDFVFMSYDLSYFRKLINKLNLQGNFYLLDYDIDNVKYQYFNILYLFEIKKDKDVITMPTNILFNNQGLACYSFGLIKNEDFKYLEN